MRHLKLTLDLKQTTDITDALSSVIAGRFRFDAALTPLNKTLDYDTEVRDDELFDSDFREFYFNYLNEALRIRIGLLKIDWVDTLFQQNNDFLTPLDLRFGGYGEAGDLIIPSPSILLSHGLLGLQWDWIIAKPVVSKIPKAANGYGFYENLESDLPPFYVQNEKIPDDSKNLEGGLRLATTFYKTEFTFFAYHGHERVPHAQFQPIIKDQQLKIGLKYPQVNTFGLFLTAGLGDAAIFRVFSLYEPRRVSDITLTLPSGSVYQSGETQRYRAGFGIDYVISQDFKFFSECSGLRIQNIATDEPNIFGSHFSEREDYNCGYRGIYLASQNMEILLDNFYTFPERSYFIAPQINLKISNSFRLFGGIRFVKSFSDLSTLDRLRDTSHVFLGIEHRLELTKERNPT